MISKYHWADMHCDSLLNAGRNGAEILWESSGHQSLKEMSDSGQLLQFFAIFFPPSLAENEKTNDGEIIRTTEQDMDFFLRLRGILMDQLSAHADRAALALTRQDVLDNAEKGLSSAMLTIEDGRILDGDLTRVSWLREMGVRAVGLTWNCSNCLGHPNSPDPTENSRGLTPFGREAVLEMNRLGILVDVSHLSDGGFQDVAALSRKPFAATHSNARAVTNHPRNLTDDMLKRLADCGGVTGLNFVPEFLNDRNLPGTVEMLMTHVRHIVQVAGEDVLGIGTDFDGFDEEQEINHPSRMHLLFEAMEKEFTPRQIEKFASGNVLRLLGDL